MIPAIMLSTQLLNTTASNIRVCLGEQGCRTWAWLGGVPVQPAWQGMLLMRLSGPLPTAPVKMVLGNLIQVSHAMTAC